MKRIVVDFNTMEDRDTVILHLGPPENEQYSPDNLEVGEVVILYTPGDIECKATVGRGLYGRWVAKIIEGTIVDL